MYKPCIREICVIRVRLLIVAEAFTSATDKQQSQSFYIPYTFVCFATINACYYAPNACYHEPVTRFLVCGHDVTGLR